MCTDTYDIYIYMYLYMYMYMEMYMCMYMYMCIVYVCIYRYTYHNHTWIILTNIYSMSHVATAPFLQRRRRPSRPPRRGSATRRSCGHETRSSPDRPHKGNPGRKRLSGEISPAGFRGWKMPWQRKHLGNAMEISCSRGNAMKIPCLRGNAMEISCSRGNAMKIPCLRGNAMEISCLSLVLVSDSCFFLNLSSVKTWDVGGQRRIKVGTSIASSGFVLVVGCRWDSDHGLQWNPQWIKCRSYSRYQIPDVEQPPNRPSFAGTLKVPHIHGKSITRFPMNIAVAAYLRYSLTSICEIGSKSHPGVSLVLKHG